MSLRQSGMKTCWARCAGTGFACWNHRPLPACDVVQMPRGDHLAPHLPREVCPSEQHQDSGEEDECEHRVRSPRQQCRRGEKQGKVGNRLKNSTIRWTRRSNQPPKSPAETPTAVPMTSESVCSSGILRLNSGFLRSIPFCYGRAGLLLRDARAREPPLEARHCAG